MKRTKFYILPIIVIVLCTAGCPPPPEEEEKEATPEEIRAQGQEILQTIAQWDSIPADRVQTQLSQLRSSMRSFREQHGNTATGREMIQLITNKVYGNARRLFESGEYAGCLVPCELVLTVNPTHARTLDLRKQAMEELSKPRVTLGGFLTTDDGLYAFVEVSYLTTGQRDSKQVRVGDEFDGYRFKKVLTGSSGKPIGIILRWIKTGRDVPLELHRP